jgi:hypothetical protein
MTRRSTSTHRLEANQKEENNISETPFKLDISQKESIYNEYKPLD